MVTIATPVLVDRLAHEHGLAFFTDVSGCGTSYMSSHCPQWTFSICQPPLLVISIFTLSLTNSFCFNHEAHACRGRVGPRTVN